MELILKHDVEGLGFKDDVVTVKNGYGRNFLIPGGKAILATVSARKVLAKAIWVLYAAVAAALAKLFF